MASKPLNRELEDEISAALGDASLEDLLADQPPSQKRGASREIKTGVVAAIHGPNVLIEFGPRLQGYCPKLHFETLPSIGDSLEFVIERRDRDGMLVLSRIGAVQKAAWDSLDIGQVVEAICTGTNKGGLEMELAGHKAFMPAGHASLHHLPDLSVLVGQKFPCEVIELDRHKNRIILSRKSVLVADQKVAREETLATLSPGDTVEATVTSLQPYGAFADIGGIEGLIHLSEMAWERVSDPAKLLKVGDTIFVKVLDIDQEHEPTKIALGMKQLIEDPFASAASTLIAGETVAGTVIKLVDFGAFVDLGHGAEGLLHISELADHRIKSVKDVVSVQQVINVKILSIDAATRKIALSLKQASGAHTQENAPLREEDNAMRKLREKFGNGPLKGGIG